MYKLIETKRNSYEELTFVIELRGKRFTVGVCTYSKLRRMGRV